MSTFYDRRSAAFASAAALLVVLLGISLGSWQLRRADEKAALQQAQDQSAATPPVPLGGNVPLPAPAAVDGRQVQAQGTFLPERSVFLDNRTRDGIAGFHVLTPLKLDDRDDHVMVLRGWIARDPQDRERLPDLTTPSSVVRVSGLAVADLRQPIMLGAEAAPQSGDRLWQHFDYDKFTAWAGLRLYPLVLRQTVEPDYRDGLARDWVQPGVSVDRHRAYAFQWFALSAVAAATWAVLLWRYWAGDGDRRKLHAQG